MKTHTTTAGRTAPNIKETDLVAGILEMLAYQPGVKAWRVNSGAIVLGEGARRRFVKLAAAGTSDIHLIITVNVGGVLLAVFGVIEVKAGKNTTTADQDAYLKDMHERGAVTTVARSIDDAQRLIENVKRALGEHLTGGTHAD